MLLMALWGAAVGLAAEPPVITSQPQSLDLFGPPEWTDSFRVEASGDAPLSYQWRKNGANLAGRTSPALELIGAGYAEGVYTVVITNVAGSVTSTPARLTITQIVSQPASTTTFVGGSATFSVTTSGSSELTFQWLKDGTEAMGATDATLTISNAQFSDGGSYHVRVSTPTRSTVSLGATLFVLPLPTPLTAVAWGDNTYGQLNVPPNVLGVTHISAGYSHSLALLANGRVAGWGEPVTGEPQLLATLDDVVAIDSNFGHGLALKRNGTVIAWGANYNGETSVPPGLTNVVAIASGYSHALALKRDGSVMGWGGGEGNVPAGLNGIAAISADHFHSLALRSNGTVVAWGYNSRGQINVPSGLSNVTAIAAGHSFSLALKSDGTVVGWGEITVPAGLSNIVAISAGSHGMALRGDGTVVAWGGGPRGEADVPEGLSNVVAISAGFFHSLALVGSAEPAIVQQPQSVATYMGADVTFTVSAVGTPPLTYQWLKDDQVMAGQTNASLTLNSIQGSDAGEYQVIVSNLRGSTTSQVANLVSTSPEIVAQPQSVITNAGVTVTFEVSANGDPPLVYQWFKNNVALEGEVGSTLVLSNVQISDDGWYSVSVSHAGGSVLSASASLTIFAVANVLKQPEDITTYRGGYAFFGVTAVSSTPIAYQWQKNGVDIVGANAAVLLLNNVQDIQAGEYQVVIQTGAGSVTSSPALLIVVAERPAGTVVSLGGGPVPEGLTNVVAVAGGVYHNMALRANGTVVAWGGREAQMLMLGITNVPGDLTDVVAIGAMESSSFALRSDGTIVTWDRQGTRTVGGLSNVVAISSSRTDSLALKRDGTVVALAGMAVPAGLSNVVAISAGFSQNLALQANGDVFSWGYRGDSVFRGHKNAVNVASGVEYYLAVQGDGTVTDWTLSGISMVPGGLSNVIAVSIGSLHSLALRRDGTIAGWGDINVPAGISNVVAIASGWPNHLLVTANPPPPELAATAIGNTVSIKFPVAVPGFVLEAGDSPTGLFETLNSSEYVYTNNSLTVPADRAQRFYRVRKR